MSFRCWAFVGLHSRCISRFVSSGGESDKFFVSLLPCPDGHGTEIILVKFRPHTDTLRKSGDQSPLRYH
jgi:hypothetical protein